MEIDEYRDAIAELWPQAGESPTKEVVEACLRAVAEHPKSSTFWYDLGLIMERCDEDFGYTAEDYRRCFENSIGCDSGNTEAYQELGYVLDTYFDAYDKAERAFRKAVELGAGYESYYGLARVLAEMGKDSEALRCLSGNACPFSQDPAIQQLRREILDGIWNPRPSRGE